MLVFLIWCLGSWVHQIHKHDTLFLFCFLLSFSFSSPDCSPPPFFPFLLSFFFFFFFLPQSWCFLLKPKPICLKLLSEINGSLSLAFFFFCLFVWVSVHMVLPTCRGEVEDVGLWGLAWWRSEFVDRHGGGCGFVVIGVYGGFWWWYRSEFGSIDDGLHDCSVAESVMVGSWIEVWWWVSVAEIGV